MVVVGFPYVGEASDKVETHFPKNQGQMSHISCDMGTKTKAKCHTFRKHERGRILPSHKAFWLIQGGRQMPNLPYFSMNCLLACLKQVLYTRLPFLGQNPRPNVTHFGKNTNVVVQKLSRRAETSENQIMDSNYMHFHLWITIIDLAEAEICYFLHFGTKPSIFGQNAISCLPTKRFG
jgi:hypothetical protein